MVLRASPFSEGGAWPARDARWLRLGQIAEALRRHGLGVLASKARLARCPNWRCRLHCTVERWLGRVEPDTPWPIAVRDTLVELGPAFVKVGQLLSVRSDLIPAALATALRSLRADVPSVPIEAVRPAIEAAMGVPLATAFRRFEATPLAAGSIAQVHEAELPDGQRVAVKVKRPGIEEVVERDLELLIWMAGQMERHLAWSRPYRPVAAANELATYTRRELDFRNEGRVARRLAAHFKGWPNVVIPAIHRQTRDVLVMGFVEGVPIDDLATLDAWGVDRQRLVETSINCLIEQVLGVGLFHADPHPGNMHVTPEGRLVILDFGIFGELGEATRQVMALSLLMLLQGDPDAGACYLIRLASLEPGADPEGYRLAIAERYRTWKTSTIHEYGFAKLVYEIVTQAARHGIVMPPEVILYVKAMTTLEGVALVLAPDLNLADAVAPYLERLSHRMFGPAWAWKAVRRALPVWLDLADRLPLAGEQLLERHLSPGAARPSRHLPVMPLAAVAAGTALLMAGVGPELSDLSAIGLALVIGGLAWGRATS